MKEQGAKETVLRSDEIDFKLVCNHKLYIFSFAGEKLRRVVILRVL